MTRLLFGLLILGSQAFPFGVRTMCARGTICRFPDDDGDYRFIARDLASLDACRAHLPSPRPLTYKCLEWSRFSADNNTYTKYNSTYR